MPFKLLKSENGFAIITAVMALMALTILGIAGTSTSSIESMISGNERAYRQNFYLAEGSAKIASDIENLKDPNRYHHANNPLPMVGGDIDMGNVVKIDSGLEVTDPYGLNIQSDYWVVDNDIPAGPEGTGHSLKEAGTQSGGRVSFFDLYGRSTGGGNSNTTIILGYTKRLSE